MNAAHLHLALVHFPIAGLIFACLGLACALVVKDTAVRRAALVLLVVAGASAAPPYFTGEEAEEVIEDVQGVSEHNIEEHEEAAKAALSASLAAGVLALGLLVVFRKKDLPTAAVGGALAVAMVAAALTGRAGNLGGLIRHPEIEMSAGAGEKGKAGEAAEKGGEKEGEKGGEDDD